MSAKDGNGCSPPLSISLVPVITNVAAMRFPPAGESPARSERPSPARRPANRFLNVHTWGEP